MCLYCSMSFLPSPCSLARQRRFKRRECLPGSAGRQPPQQTQAEIPEHYHDNTIIIIILHLLSSALSHPEGHRARRILIAQYTVIVSIIVIGFILAVVFTATVVAAVPVPEVCPAKRDQCLNQCPSFTPLSKKSKYLPSL